MTLKGKKEEVIHPSISKSPQRGKLFGSILLIATLTPWRAVCGIKIKGKCPAQVDPEFLSQSVCSSRQSSSMGDPFQPNNNKTECFADTESLSLVLCMSNI